MHYIPRADTETGIRRVRGFIFHRKSNTRTELKIIINYRLLKLYTDQRRVLVAETDGFVTAAEHPLSSTPLASVADQ